MTTSTAAPLEIRRVIAAPIEEVFAAWLDQNGMREWFSPSGAATMTADFRPGGSFHLVMSDENVSVEPTGVFRVIDPPRLLVFTWRSQYTGGRDTLVSVRLTSRGPSDTEVKLTHEQLPVDQIEPHTQGWTRILEHLDAHLGRGGRRRVPVLLARLPGHGAKKSVRSAEPQEGEAHARKLGAQMNAGFAKWGSATELPPSAPGRRTAWSFPAFVGTKALGGLPSE
jgi:uncharacterized protein YndB with AHSA1/START domain